MAIFGAVSRLFFRDENARFEAVFASSLVDPVTFHFETVVLTLIARGLCWADIAAQLILSDIAATRLAGSV